MPGGWKNALRERWVTRPGLGLPADLIEDRLFVTAPARNAPAGDRLYLHNVAAQFDGEWAVSMDAAHGYAGDVKAIAGGNFLLAEVTQDASNGNRYLPQIIKVDSGGTVQAAAYMTDSLSPAFNPYTTDMQVSAGTAGYVFCANSSNQSSTTGIPILYALSADLATLLWAGTAPAGNTSDRIYDVRAAADGNSAFYSGSWYYTNRSVGVCYQVDYTGALNRVWVLDQVSSAKNCIIFNSDVDTSGNLYLFGYANGGTTQGSMVVKFDTSNTVVWQKCLGGNAYAESDGFVVSTGGLYHCQSDGSSGLMLSKVSSAGAVSGQTRLYQTGTTLMPLSFRPDGADGAYVLARVIDTTEYMVLIRLDSSFSILWQVKIAPTLMASYATFPSGNIAIDSSYVYVSMPVGKITLKMAAASGMSPCTLDAGGDHETVISAGSIASQAGSTTVTTTAFDASSGTYLSLSAGPSGFAVRSSGFTPAITALPGLTVTGVPRAAQVDGNRFPGGFTNATLGVFGMDRTPGAAQVARSFASVASATARQGVLLGVYASPPLNNPQWIGDGDAALYVADSVSNAALDFTAGSPEVYIWRPSTYQRVGTLHSAAGERYGTKSTSEKVTVARFRPCPIYALAGDVVVVELWGQVLSTGIPSYTGYAYLDGTTENDTADAAVSNYATNIRFSEALTFNIVAQTHEVAITETASASATQASTAVMASSASEAGNLTDAPTGNRLVTSDGTASLTATESGASTLIASAANTEAGSAVADVTGGPVYARDTTESGTLSSSQDFSAGQFAVRDEAANSQSQQQASAMFVADHGSTTAASAAPSAVQTTPVSATATANADGIPVAAWGIAASSGESATGADYADSVWIKGGRSTEAATATASQNGIGTMGVAARDGDGDPLMWTVGLLMHMEGENTGKETVDLMGHAVTFIAQAEMSTTQAKYGSASLYCPDIGGAISISKDGLFVFPGDFTIEGYAMLETSGTNQGIAVLDHSFNIKASGAFAGYFTVNIGVDQTTHPTSMPTGQFYHWAVVRKDGLVRIFLAGIKSTNTPISNTATMEALPGGLILGSYGQYGEGPLEGWLDEVRISRFARYTDDFTPPSAPFANYQYTGALATEEVSQGTPTTAEQAESASASDTPLVSKMRIAAPITEAASATASIDGDTSSLISVQHESVSATSVAAALAGSIDAGIIESATASALMAAGYTVAAVVSINLTDSAGASVATAAGRIEHAVSAMSASATVQFVVTSTASASAGAESSSTKYSSFNAAITEAVNSLAIVGGQILGKEQGDSTLFYALQQVADLFLTNEVLQVTVLTKQDGTSVKD